MKRIVSFVCAVVLACVCLNLGACSGVGALVKLTYEDGCLVDGERGITYINAPMCYEPVSLMPDPYAECKENGVVLYPIEGLDSNLWLSEAFAGVGSIYYAEGEVTLSGDIADFEPVSIIICIEDVITTGIAQVSDKADVAAAVDAFVNGESVPLVRKGESYELKFLSSKYESIYYSLLYIDGDDGENYIYDRTTKRCVAVGDVLGKYISDTAS